MLSRLFHQPATAGWSLTMKILFTSTDLNLFVDSLRSTYNDETQLPVNWDTFTTLKIVKPWRASKKLTFTAENRENPRTQMMVVFSAFWGFQIHLKFRTRCVKNRLLAKLLGFVSNNWYSFPSIKDIPMVCHDLSIQSESTLQRIDKTKRLLNFPVFV